MWNRNCTLILASFVPSRSQQFPLYCYEKLSSTGVNYGTKFKKSSTPLVVVGIKIYSMMQGFASKLLVNSLQLTNCQFKHETVQGYYLELAEFVKFELIFYLVENSN